jgi:iron-sulfur cluster repair protein YtfE (RIC family)
MTGGRKSSVAEEICNALKIHAQIEEEIFYPAARDALKKEDVDLIDEADVEHATIKGLVGRIGSVGESDAHYDALVTVLGEYVKHHVKEEENELFPKLRRSKMNLDAVGAALAWRKKELEGNPARRSS